MYGVSVDHLDGWMVTLLCLFSVVVEIYKLSRRPPPLLLCSCVSSSSALTTSSTLPKATQPAPGIALEKDSRTNFTYP